MTKHQKRFTLGYDTRIRCKKCDRDLLYEKENSEIMDYGNVVTFTCSKCGSDMEICFK